MNESPMDPLRNGRDAAATESTDGAAAFAPAPGAPAARAAAFQAWLDALDPPLAGQGDAAEGSRGEAGGATPPQVDATDRALAEALLAARRPVPAALLGRRFATVDEEASGATAPCAAPGDAAPAMAAPQPPHPAGGDPALTPLRPRRSRLLELAVAASVILAGAWLFRQGPGRPLSPEGSQAAGGGIGADAATMPAGLVPKSADVQLRLLDQLGGPVTLQAVDAAGHLAILRGRRLELYQLSAPQREAPLARLLGRSDLLDTPMLDLAIVGERALLLEDAHPTEQGLVEIDLGPGFRLGEAGSGVQSALGAEEGVLLPWVRRRRVSFFPHGEAPEPGKPYLRPFAMDVVPEPGGAIPPDAWVLIRRLDETDLDVKLARLVFDADALSAERPRREGAVRLLERGDGVVIDTLVDLPYGARDLAVGRSSVSAGDLVGAAASGDDRLLSIAFGPWGEGEADMGLADAAGHVESGIGAYDMSNPRSPRRVAWTARENVSHVVREPRTGWVYDLSHTPKDRADGRGGWAGVQKAVLGRGPRRAEIHPSVQDGRESLVVLAQGAEDQRLLAVLSNAEVFTDWTAVTLAEERDWHQSTQFGRHVLALHRSKALIAAFRNIWRSGAEDQPREAQLLLRKVADGQGLQVTRPQLEPVTERHVGLALEMESLDLSALATPAPMAIPGLAADAAFVEQDGFTIALEPGIGLAVVDREGRQPPRVTRRLALPGALRVAGFAGGVAVLVAKPLTPTPTPLPNMRRRGGDARAYEVVTLDLLDEAGLRGPTPSLTQIDRWAETDVDPALFAADGRVGRGWRDATVFVGYAGSLGLNAKLGARHRLWATGAGRSWADRLMRDAGRQPIIGSRVNATKGPPGYAGFFGGYRLQPTNLLAMYASRGLLYLFDARQGLIIVDVVTDPYWAHVAVPVERPAGHGAAPSFGLDLDLRLGDGRDRALDGGYVWLTGHPQYLAPLGRQLWTEPARLRREEGGGLGFEGGLELPELPPTVHRVGGGPWVPVRLEARPVATLLP